MAEHKVSQIFSRRRENALRVRFNAAEHKHNICINSIPQTNANNLLEVRLIAINRN